MHIEIEQETDGRWIAEVTDLPGAMAYGKSRGEAIQFVKALALRVIADRLEHAEPAGAITPSRFTTPPISARQCRHGSGVRPG